MGSVQSLFVLWSMVLFSVLVLTYQNASNDQMTVNFENEAIVTATAIGQSVLETIQVKAFDEATVSTNIQNPFLLTFNLGTETGETSETLYDDVDDYDHYQTAFKMSRLDSFKVSVKVFYIGRYAPKQQLFIPTFSKRINIQVDNNYLKNPIKLFGIVSY